VQPSSPNARYVASGLLGAPIWALDTLALRNKHGAHSPLNGPKLALRASGPRVASRHGGGAARAAPHAAHASAAGRRAAAHAAAAARQVTATGLPIGITAVMLSNMASYIAADCASRSSIAASGFQMDPARTWV